MVEPLGGCMLEVLFSLACLSLLFWVVCLKMRITRLENEKKKLSNALKMGVRKMTEDVEVQKTVVPRLHKQH